MKIKSIKLLALLLIVFSFTYAQDFEGKIIYKNTFKSKMPGVTDEQFTQMMGDTQEYFLKGGDYKSVANGTMLQWQMYINKDNKLYMKMGNMATILWNDGATNPDEVIKAEVNRGVLEVAGYSCDELILTCKTGVQKYYFSSKLKIDPKSFSKHKFGNWSEVISRTNAVPLKMIIDSAQFTIESTATEIVPMKLEASLFVLPADAKVEKSPF